jgi:putative ATPase
MKDLGYGKNYAYAHSYEGNFKAMEFLPEEINGLSFYQPGGNPSEDKIRARLKNWWKEKYDY